MSSCLKVGHYVRLLDLLKIQTIHAASCSLRFNKKLHCLRGIPVVSTKYPPRAMNYFNLNYHGFHVDELIIKIYRPEHSS